MTALGLASAVSVTVIATGGAMLLNRQGAAGSGGNPTQIAGAAVATLVSATAKGKHRNFGLPE